MLLAAALAAAYLIIAPTGADLPAQLLRAKLFGAEGFGLWNNWWYGGSSVAAYSVLFPPLAWLLTPQLTAALASVATAWAGAELAYDGFGESAWLGASWLGAATVTELLSGRLTFALGLCGVALTALAIERRRRPAACAALALLTALASPVAALFAALAGATALIVSPERRAAGAAVIAGSIAPVLALAIAFPTPGSQPFALSVLWPVLVAGGAIVVLASAGPLAGARSRRTLTLATLLYLVGCVLAYALSTPLGANAARLGELLAGPLVALLLTPRRTYIWLALAALPLTYIQVHDAASDLQRGWRAPYDSAAYYRPLIGYLERQPGARRHLWRVEVPFTAGHWESYYLAPEIPLARGWERQLDIAYDPLFYGGKLTAATYRRWLRRLAVRYVAVPDAPPDYAARAELRLIHHGLPYLRAVARPPHWTVYAVTDAAPLASGTARVTSMEANSLTLDVARPGSTLLRVRYSPYWRLTGVHGCVAPAGQLTRINASQPGHAHLITDFGLSHIGSRSPRCS